MPILFFSDCQRAKLLTPAFELFVLLKRVLPRRLGVYTFAMALRLRREYMTTQDATERSIRSLVARTPSKSSSASHGIGQSVYVGCGWWTIAVVLMVLVI